MWRGYERDVEFGFVAAVWTSLRVYRADREKSCRNSLVCLNGYGLSASGAGHRPGLRRPDTATERSQTDGKAHSGGGAHGRKGIGKAHGGQECVHKIKSQTIAASLPAVGKAGAVKRFE